MAFRYTEAGNLANLLAKSGYSFISLIEMKEVLDEREYTPYYIECWRNGWIQFYVESEVLDSVRSVNSLGVLEYTRGFH